jgi:hypothetical protein
MMRHNCPEGAVLVGRPLGILHKDCMTCGEIECEKGGCMACEWVGHAPEAIT